MADAIAAFQEAFASYRSKPADYAVYSFLTSMASAVAVVALFLALAVLGVLSAGGITNIAASGQGLSLSLAGIALVVVVLAIGLLVFAWLQCGIYGAYFESASTLLAGRKQTIGGFFGSVPKHATPILSAYILAGLISALPLAGFFGLGLLLGDLAVVVMGAMGVVAALLLWLLFTFLIPSIVVDGKGAAAAIKASFSLSIRNIAGVVVYFVVCSVLALPMLVPLVNVFYAVLFFTPMTTAALFSLYKRSK